MTGDKGSGVFRLQNERNTLSLIMIQKPKSACEDKEDMGLAVQKVAIFRVVI